MNSLAELRARAAQDQARKSAKKLAEAVRAFARHDYKLAALRAVDACEADPQSGPAYHQLALAFERLGDTAKAISMYERAAALAPDDPAIVLNLGLLAWKLNLLPGAEKAFRVYCAARPNEALGWNNLASVLRDQSRFAEAIALCQDAITRLPQEPMLWNTLGTVLAREGRYGEAEVFYAEALRLDPKNGRVWHNLGDAFFFTSQLARAREAHEHAQRHLTDPHDRLEADYARANVELASGDLAKGFESYQAIHNPAYRHAMQLTCTAPRWNGEDITGKTLLVFGDQGLGDEVMFASQLPDVMSCTGAEGKVLIACEKRLVSLFARAFPAAEVGAHETLRINAKAVRRAPFADGRAIDACATFSGLAPILRREARQFPGAPFLTPCPDRQAAAAAFLNTLPAGRKIGLCWRSMVIDSHRWRFYAPIRHWLPVLQTKGAQFVSLQYGNVREEIAWLQKEAGVTLHAMPGLDLKDDLEGLAALAASCDLVIAAPTASSQIAAAAGAPVWFVNSYPWEFAFGSEGVPWYRGARSLAPKEMGAWDGFFPELAEELSAWLQA